MKYIKTYEEVNNGPIDDIRNTKYWRFKNNQNGDFIMRVDDIYYDDDLERFKFLIFNLIENSFEVYEVGAKLVFDEIINNTSNIISRPATQKEIENFKFNSNLNKYNL